MQAGATLRTGDLQKNGMLDPEALYNLIYKGKGKMPGYGINCAPRVCISPLRMHMHHSVRRVHQQGCSSTALATECSGRTAASRPVPDYHITLDAHGLGMHAKCDRFAKICGPAGSMHVRGKAQRR